MKNKKIKELTTQTVEVLKSQGVKISRGNIYALGKRHVQENASAISEGQQEQSLLRMKSFYKRKGWLWPPKKHPVVTIVHLINKYYGKDVCIHTPKDAMEKMSITHD